MKLARMLQALRQMVSFRGRASRTRQVRMTGFRAKFRRFLAVEGLEHRRVLDSGSLVVTTEVGTGPGSLYSMIELANSQAGPNRIEFAQGVVNVRPGASLPPITDSLVVDGGGRVTIDGAGSPGNGLVIKGSDVSIKNISIGGFASGTGILFQGADKGRVQGVKIGTNLSGSLATPNNYGIEVDGSSNITIGIDGDGQGDVDEANVISGNKREAIVVKGDKSIGTLIAGNFIGTDATGEAAIPNGEGVWISSGSSSTLVRGNTISGNVGSGMNISSAKDSVVEGNIIGLNAKGTAKIANMGNAGVVIYGNAQNTRIGTDGNGIGDVAERNIISGNTQEGIQIEASDNTVVAGNYIGTNIDGSKALPNSKSGILIWNQPTRARIGTDNSNDQFNENEKNLISGNKSDGITVTQSAKDTVIAGNWVGIDATGQFAIPNSHDGLWVGGGPISTRIRGNTISGNTGSGIGISNATGTVVDGNIIGLNPTGTEKLANVGNAGVVVYGGARNTRIGTDGDGIADSLERNVISGNAQEGIQIEASDNTVVAGNYIGTNLDGSRSLANTYSGILIWGTPTRTRIGTDGSNDSFNENERNLISGNDSNGITVTQSAKDTFIAGNWIGLNAQGSNVLTNSGIGIEISGNATTTIIGTDGNGTSDSQERNIISGNNRGIAVSGSGATLTTIAGNWVGLDSTGNIAFGNNNGGGDGIWLINGAKKVLVGTNGDGISDTIERNTIAGHAAAGIAIYNANTNENRISGNWIGLNASGTTPLKNTYGIALGYSSNGIGPSNNIIGTNSDGVSDSAERNIISGNTYGILLDGLGVNKNIVSGNYIGTNTDGSAPIGNSYGVFVQSGASENRIGTNGDGINDSIEGNLISGNSYGIIVSGSQTEKTIISGNVIGADSLVSNSIQNLYGIYVYNGASKTTIGSDEFITLNKKNASNVISGNFYGVYVVNPSTQDVWISSNYIGVARDGTTPIANQTAGIYIGSEATRVSVGGSSEDLGNIIAYNETGVRLNVPTANTKLYRSNRYYNNTTIAIDFGNDFHTPNDNGDKDGIANYPIITSVTRSSDSLVIEGFSAPGSIIDFYSTQKYDDGFGQGNYFIASGVEGSLDDLDDSTGSYDSITLGGIPVGSETTNRFRFILPYSTLKKSVFPGEYITAIKAFSTSEFGNQSVVRSDFSLSNAKIPENAGANGVVGTLAVSDPDAVNTFTYSLVSGTGDADNAAFNISGNTLRASGSFDYENMSAYAVRIRATDQGGLFIEKAFTINVTNVNEAPTDLYLSNSTIPENSGEDASVGVLASMDDRHPTVIANFDNLPALPTINSYAGLSSSNNGSSDYSGVTWDSRFQIVGRDYVEQFVNQGSNTYLRPRSASFAAINANGDSGLTMQTTKILTGAWFARVDLGNGAYGATSITIHALNGTTILGSVTKELNSTVPSFVDASQFLNLTGITGYRIDRVAQVSGIASRLGSWMADDFAFTEPSANTFGYTLVSGTGDSDNAAFNISGNTLRATSSFDFETKSSYTIRIRSTDQGGLYNEKAFTINVTNTNDAPVLNPDYTASMGSVLEGATNPSGISIADLLLDGSITDQDGIAIKAIAINGVNTTLGTWQFRQDGNSLWNTINSERVNSQINELVLLLGPSAQLRMIPFGSLNGSIADGISYRAWDMTSGTQGTYNEVSSVGGATPFSLGSTLASIDVTAVNNAPTFRSGDGIVSTRIGANEDLARSVVVQPDGKILMGGYGTVAGSSFSDFALVRYNQDGSVDSTFGSGGKVITDFFGNRDVIYSVALQPDGKIVVGGLTTSNTYFIIVALARYNTDGSLDMSFGTGGKVTTGIQGQEVCTSIMIRDDGKIVVAGWGFAPSGTTAQGIIIQYNSNGSLDTGFGTGGMISFSQDSQFWGAVLQADGKVVAGGTRNLNGAVGADFGAERYNADGSIDKSFGVNGTVSTDFNNSDDYGRAIAIQQDGKVVLVGLTVSSSGTSDIGIVRYNADGSLDTTFGQNGKVVSSPSNGSDEGLSIAIQRDGKILVAGSESSSSQKAIFVSRYNTNGSLDSTFGANGSIRIAFTNGYAIAQTISVQLDGKILVGGTAPSSSSNADFVLVRYNPDGSLDTTFDLVNTLGGSVNYVENGTAVVMDNNVKVMDAELRSSNYSGATLSLSRVGGANPQDAFKASGVVGSLNEGNDLVVTGVAIGTVTTNSNGTLLLSFNSAASNDLVNTVLQSVAYENLSDSPPQSVQILWDFNDGNQGAQGLGGASSATGTVTINITSVNDNPNDISLTPNFIAENAGANATVGTFLTTDPDAADTFTYTLVAGDGSTDNAAFNISGSNLRATSSFNFETKSSYTVRVRSTDQGGLWTEKAFTINVTDTNEIPTDISLSSSSINENAGANATVGTLSTTDPDALNTFTYSLVSGAGDSDNVAFNITGNTLRANSSFDFENKSSYSIRIRSTDQGGLYSEKAFTINVVNANELVSVSVNGADSYINASQRSQITSLVVVTESVLSDPQTAFSLTNIGLFTTSSTSLASSQILVTNVGNVYTIRFGTGSGVVTRGGFGARANSLADGNWILSVSNTEISGANQFGNRAVDNFFRMFGDSDGDGDVDGLDAVALRRAQLAASYNAALDWDGNGSVSTGVDINNFSANVNKRRRSF